MMVVSRKRRRARGELTASVISALEEIDSARALSADLALRKFAL